jgi:cytoskeletal protein CcmA (bactofilin family)
MRIGRKRDRESLGFASINTLVGGDAMIVGDISFKGGLHVEGRIEGDVSAEDANGRAILVLSETGVIQGQIRVPNVILNGTVEGDVYVSHRLELATRARIRGDVYYSLLEMAIGAEVNGNLIHLGSLRSRCGSGQEGSPLDPDPMVSRGNPS